MRNISLHNQWRDNYANRGQGLGSRWSNRLMFLFQQFAVVPAMSVVVFFQSVTMTFRCCFLLLYFARRGGCGGRGVVPLTVRKAIQPREAMSFPFQVYSAELSVAFSPSPFCTVYDATEK